MGASSIAAFSIAFFAQIFGAPNTWGLDKSGKLVKDFETEEFKAAVGFVRDLYQAGVFHPNTATNTNTASDADFSAGKVVFSYATWTGFSTVYWPQSRRSTRLSSCGRWLRSASDGTTKPQFIWVPATLGTHSFASPRPSARVSCWCSKLPGRAVRQPGAHAAELWRCRAQITLSTNAPIPCPRPKDSPTRPVPWRFLTQFPSVLYNTNNAEEFARVAHAGEEAMVPAGVQNPVLAATRRLQRTRMRCCSQTFLSAVIDIVSRSTSRETRHRPCRTGGRKGGDTMRAEYEQALRRRQDSRVLNGVCMLSHEENELITRVGPGTPMGNLMRAVLDARAAVLGAAAPG